MDGSLFPVSMDVFNLVPEDLEFHGDFLDSRPDTQHPDAMLGEAASPNANQAPFGFIFLPPDDKEEVTMEMDVDADGGPGSSTKENEESDRRTISAISVLSAIEPAKGSMEKIDLLAKEMQNEEWQATIIASGTLSAAKNFGPNECPLCFQFTQHESVFHDTLSFWKHWTGDHPLNVRASRSAVSSPLKRLHAESSVLSNSAVKKRRVDTPTAVYTLYTGEHGHVGIDLT